MLAGCVEMVTVLGASQPPEFCAEARLDNRCETTLAMLAGHVVLFVVLWLVPWWRGLRTLRILLAILAAVVLVLAPIRMA
ncbi:hypothetical protein [Micromonospora eburnea]|uniref:Uncharacterized protein n=1 Tax=Micromonospora eburnea TaxID=227316 RepID=A0A1C6TUZ0_9ACTN|nr:hypothetical protein [Micromonospora eburnea]SCL45483.1 hypothetical protein GA0070604_0987 [Micromonospora eburnea]